jgi:hypothetical protein
MLTKPDSGKKTTSHIDLGSFWHTDAAYIKTVMMNGKPVYAIHSADGTPLAVAEGRDLAFAAARQNDLTPASVH